MKKVLGVMLVFLFLSLTLVSLASAKVVEVKNQGPFTRVKIIHENKPDFVGINPAKPEKPGKPAPGTGRIQCDSSGSIFLNTPEYYLNPLTIPSSLTQNFVVDSLVSSTQEWDKHTSNNLFIDSPTLDNTKYALGKISGYPIDFENVVVFGDLSSGTIGVTYLTWWTATGEIADWDMILNTDYLWGDATLGNYMDLQNILTHELGHSLGLKDLYNRKCSSMTMFGYSGYNDIGKRSLEQDDILSLLKVYSN